jgi:acetyl-CoA carboxylase carboxyltransferase component
MMWPNARISVMDGEPAATVLDTVGPGAGNADTAAQEELKERIRAPYENPGAPLRLHRTGQGTTA